MNICLVRCRCEFLIDDRVAPPLGLMAVGAGLLRQGHEVTIYDGDLDNVPVGYDGYGLGPTAPEYSYALSVRESIRRNNPEARIVLGGPHATINSGMCEGWDCIVVGDGEVEAAQAFTGNDSIIIAQEGILDEYPLPDRTLVNIHSYHYTLEGRAGTTLVTSRGCPFSCAFCCKNHKRVRLRSAESVITEVDLLRDRFGYRALGFPEDIFILDRQRAERIADHLKARGILWRCLVRADVVVRHGAEFLQTLADSGCVSVGIGIESGSDKILANISKGESTQTITTAISMLKDAGIKVKGFFILGLPGEDESTLEETERFLDRVSLDEVELKIYQPYPGSPIYEKPEQFDIGWKTIDLADSFFKGRRGDYRGSVFTSKLTTDRIVEVWRKLMDKYETIR